MVFCCHRCKKVKSFVYRVWQRKMAKHLLKKQLQRHVFGAVIYLRICCCPVLHKSNLLTSPVEFGSGRRSDGWPAPQVAGEARGRPASLTVAVVLAGPCRGSLFWHDGEKSLWEEKSRERNLPGWCLPLWHAAWGTRWLLSSTRWTCP